MKQKTKRAIFYLVVVLVLIFASLTIATRTSGNDLTYATYTVQPGDTIWDIAEEYCPKGMDIREYIYKVREINDSNCVIHPGQEMKIIRKDDS